MAHDGHRLTVPITRAEFEALTRDLLVRTRLTTQQVLAQAGLTWGQVDKVLMVGGCTHMPMTRPRAPRAHRPGAGPLAGRQRGGGPRRGRARRHPAPAQAPCERRATVANALADVVEISVNAHSLGVEVRQAEERVNDMLVPKNTQLPAVAEQTYYTVADNQTRVRVRILQGEAHQAEACIPVGECWIDGLPGNLPKGSPVQVRCGVAANGRIEVMATDLTSGRAATAAIHRPGGLTDEQLAREAEWVGGLRIL